MTQRKSEEHQIKEVLIDVRDIDYTWFENVKAYYDRTLNLYHFPRESLERLGEMDAGTGDFHLIDGHVEAKAGGIVVDGQSIPAWSVGCNALITRPTRHNHRRGNGGVSRA